MIGQISAARFGGETMTNATSTRVYNFAVGNPDPGSFPGQ